MSDPTAATADGGQGPDTGADPAGEGLRQRTVDNIGLTALWNGARTVTSFGARIVLARLLLKSDFALIGLAHALVGLFGRFGDLGIGQAIVQRRHDVERAYETGFVLRWVVLCAGALVVAAIAPLWAAFYEQPILQSMIWVLVTPFFFGAFFFVPGIRLYRDMKHGRASFASFLGDFAALGVTILCAVAGLGVWSFVWGSIAGSLVGWITLFAFSPWRPRLRYDPGIARELIGFGKFVLAAQLLAYGISVIDNLIVGKVLGLDALGLYLLAFSLGSLAVTEVAELVSRALFPSMAHMQSDPAALLRAFRAAVRATAIIVCPLSLGLVAVAPDFIVGIYGAKWADADDALRILCALGLILSLERVAEPVLHALGVPSVVMRGRVFMLVTMAVVLPLAAVAAGLEGAAVGAVLAAVVGTAVVLRGLSARLPLTVEAVAGDVGPPLLAGATMMLGVSLTRDLLLWPGAGPLGALAVQVAVGVVLYTVLVLVTMPRQAHEVLSAARTLFRR